MSGEPAATVPVGPAPASAPEPSRAQLWAETIAVAAVVYLPWLAAGIRGWRAGSSSPREWTVSATSYRLLASIAAGALPLLFVGTSRESWVGFGMPRLKPLRDFGQGCVVLALDLLLLQVFHFIEQPRSFTLHVGSRNARPETVPLLLGVAGIVASAFVQELVFRSWLLTRLSALTRKTWAALAISSVLFASFHIYQRPLAVAEVGVAGFIYGLTFLATRRIWPCVVAHAAYNLMINL